MRFSDFRSVEKLKEASGVFNRKPGQTFVHQDTNHTLTFDKIEAFPQDKQQFDDAAERDKVKKELDSALDVKIQWTNTPTSGTLAIGLAYLLDNDNPGPDGKPSLVVFGRYFKERKLSGLPATWDSKYFNGYNLATKAGAKQKAPFKPQDIIGIEENKYDGIESIMSSVRNFFGNKPEVVAGFETLAQGKMPIVMEGHASDFEAIRDYAGEVLQPIGLMSGAIKGDAEKARADLLGGANWSDWPVYWPADENHNLVDSVFVGPNGEEVGVSSKGKNGADASVKNIFDAIEKARTKNPALIDSYERTVQVVEAIQSDTAKIAPFKIAVAEKLISQKTADEIMETEKQPLSVEDIMAHKNPEFQKVFNAYGAQLKHQNYNSYLHLLSNTAKMVADHLNNDPQIGEGMLKFMNQASIVQIYTNGKAQGDDAVINNFRSVYPPQFKGTILFNAGKNYTSTRQGGKMAFTYQKS